MLDCGAAAKGAYGCNGIILLALRCKSLTHISLFR